MTTLYHNPRCRKSREALGILQEAGKEVDIVLYLDQPLDEPALRQLIAQLGISPIDLIRKGEAAWKEHYKGKTLTDDQVIAAMVKFPKLMERPVAVYQGKAIIGRPPEQVLDLY